MNQPVQKLRVIVVGSGIAGLVATRVIREHHDVTIYERASPRVATGGQGIAIWSNAMHVLGSIGFDNKNASAVPCGGWTSWSQDGRLLFDHEVDFLNLYGAETNTMKRSDFRGELLRLATASSEELGVPVQPVQTFFNTPVVDVDPSSGKIVLDDGTTDEADVIIIADGIHSRLRNRILGSKQHAPKKVGLTCYRLVISLDKMREAVDELPSWCQPASCKGRFSLFEDTKGTSRSIMIYPIHNFEDLNVSCIMPTSKSRAGVIESWYAEANLEELKHHFADYHEDIVKMIKIAEEVKVWDLQDMDPLPTYASGRAMLIGDAAHAMTLLQGQGANMAVEDGGSFRLLTAKVTREEVPAILKRIDEVRRPRAVQVLGDTRSTATDKSAEGKFARVDRNLRYKALDVL